MKKIYENGYIECELLKVYSSNNWTCEINDQIHELALAVQITDMFEATGEKEYKDSRYIVSFSLIAKNPDISISKDICGDEYEGPISDYMDVMMYCGGVPIDHILLDQDAAKLYIGNIKAKDGILITDKSEFGTVAAQRGRNYEFTYPRFKNPEAAEEYVKFMLSLVDPHFLMIGFVLDLPINLAGDAGWDKIELQVNGI